MSYGPIKSLGTHRKEECHQDKPLFGNQILKGIRDSQWSGHWVVGFARDSWSFLEIPGRDKEAGPA